MAKRSNPVPSALTQAAFLGRPLFGKVALVTGAARRIGRAVALTLAKSGADVAISYRNSADEAEALVAELASLGCRAAAFCCDLASEPEIAALGHSVIAHFGHLDILINNAGYFSQAPLAELPLEEWDKVFATNTRAPFLLARTLIGELRKGQGRIINIGSLGGSHPWATHGHYCASKAALEMLTRTMAKSWAPEVSVNCVAPGWIEFPEDRREVAAHFAAKTPMGRNGCDEDVADAVLQFACGPHFVTGQILAVDGGLGL